MYTRKHYQDISAIIAEAVRGAKVAIAHNTAGTPASHDGFVILAAHARIADDMARKFALDNPRFDRALFFAACELDV